LKGEPGQPPEVAQDYRIQLHSPAQAASILARLLGLNRRTSDFQSDYIAEETSPDTQCAQVGNLPDSSPPVGHPSFVPSSSPDSSSNLSSLSPPAPQPAEFPAAASQPSPGSPQRSPLQTLRRIGRRIRNLRKITATQCLESNSTHPTPTFTRSRLSRRCSSFRISPKAA